MAARRTKRECTRAAAPARRGEPPDVPTITISSLLALFAQAKSSAIGGPLHRLAVEALFALSPWKGDETAEALLAAGRYRALAELCPGSALGACAWGIPREGPWTVAELAALTSTLVGWWSRCTRPTELIDLYKLSTDRRGLVRASGACARTVLGYLPEAEPRAREVIETAEAWARGAVSAKSLAQAMRACNAVHGDLRDRAEYESVIREALFAAEYTGEPLYAVASVGYAIKAHVGAMRRARGELAGEAYWAAEHEAEAATMARMLAVVQATLRCPEVVADPDD